MKRYRNNYPVAVMSKVLGVSSSGYYKWIKAHVKSASKEEALVTEIKKIYQASFKTYGSPRIAQVLRDKHIPCSKTTVGRKMKAYGISARPRRKYVRTTDSSHEYKLSENILNRGFEVDHVNTAWVSDITYVRVDNAWMYLTTVIDLADRMVVGWSLSKNMSTRDTVISAFKKAAVSRGISKKSGLLIHSDRGVQYASNEFRLLISTYGCIQSMSRKGNCWDNAVAESFFKTIKVEALNRYVFKDSTSLRRVIFRYIDGWYNTMRIHSSLGGISPLKALQLKSIKLAA
jgi:transposase InsO family protein